jgi:hypothetical protein
VARLGLLHGIDRQRADGVDRQLIALFLGHAFPLLIWTARFQRASRS